MTTRAEALEKIKKLLSLANRPGTPAEGELALAMASNLAVMHNITIRKKGERLEAEAKRINAEQKRRDKTFKSVYEKGFLAYFEDIDYGQNPYSKTVWSVNLPFAWASGWRAARDIEVAKARKASGL